MEIYYLREVPDDHKPGTNVRKSVGDYFIGQAAVIDSDAVRDEDNEFAGRRSEGILRCLHQTKIAVTFLEVEFFVPVNHDTTKSELRQKVSVNYEIFFVNGLNSGVAVVASCMIVREWVVLQITVDGD